VQETVAAPGSHLAVLLVGQCELEELHPRRLRVQVSRQRFVEETKTGSPVYVQVQ